MWIYMGMHKPTNQRTGKNKPSDKQDKQSPPNPYKPHPKKQPTNQQARTNKPATKPTNTPTKTNQLTRKAPLTHLRRPEHSRGQHVPPVVRHEQTIQPPNRHTHKSQTTKTNQQTGKTHAPAASRALPWPARSPRRPSWRRPPASAAPPSACRRCSARWAALWPVVEGCVCFVRGRERRGWVVGGWVDDERID